MNDRWDLSFLYAEGFDDPAFIEDLEALPTEISNAQALLEGSLPPAEKLESFMDALERIAVRMEKVSSLTYMNQAVDAENTVAARYMDKISLLMNELELVESAVQRYVGSLDNLDEVISASPKLQELSFVLHGRTGPPYNPGRS